MAIVQTFRFGTLWIGRYIEECIADSYGR